MCIRGSGLLWAEWRRTRKALGIGLTLQVGGIVYIIWRRLAGGGDLGGGLAFWSSCVAICVFMVLLLSQSSSSEMRLAIPRRAFLLPISTTRLVSWLFFYRLAALLTTAGLATVARALTTAPTEAWLTPLIGFVVVFSALQALVWIAPWAGTWTTYTLAVFAFVPGAIVLYSRYEPHLPDHRARAIAFSAFCVAASFVVCCLALRSLRSGGRVRGGYATVRPLGARFNLGRSRFFASETRALSWFEWRNDRATATLFFLGLLLAMNGLLHLGSYLEISGGAELDLERQWMNGLFLLLATAVLARFWIGTRGVLQARRAPGGFLNRHPLDDIDLARGKIAGAAYVVLLLSAVVVGGTAILLALTQWLTVHSIVSITPTAPLWAFIPIILAFTWVAYWQGWLIVALCAGLFSAAWALKEFEPVSALYAGASPEHGLLFAVVLNTSVVIPSSMNAYRCGLLSGRALCLLALATAGISCVCASCLRTCGFFETFRSFELWTFCGALSLLAMSPFATAPLSVYYARHR
ncbi:MAG: hypothetical protein HZB26_23685 [Candidatus Hydrogenedentes bacterium]|nr:hypothetical protein [Candidatus Hydrogenedentota bacterium]